MNEELHKGGERERRPAEGTPPNISAAHASSNRGEGSGKDKEKKKKATAKQQQRRRTKEIWRMYPYGTWVMYTYYVKDADENTGYPGMVMDRLRERGVWKVRIMFPDGEWFDTPPSDERLATRRITENDEGYKLRDEDGKVRTDHNGKCEKCYIDYETAEEYYEHKCPRVRQGNEQKLKKKDGKEQAHKGRKAPSKHEEAQSVRGSEEEAGEAYELSG